jgi:sedoheptulose-bisphosphatase
MVPRRLTTAPSGYTIHLILRNLNKMSFSELDSLSSFFQSVMPTNGFQQLRDSVLPTLVDAIIQISDTVKASHHISAGPSNVSAGEILSDVASKCPTVNTASTDGELVHRSSDEACINPGEEEEYSVTFDPPDGSPNIPANWTVSVIIGIWSGRTIIHQTPSEKLVASILGIFGPRTTAVISLRLPGSKPLCFEAEIGLSGFAESIVIRPEIRLSPSPYKTRYFAPANLAAGVDNQRYTDLITHFIQNKYALRYNGGLAPDIVFALLNGHGIYISPVTSASKPKMMRVFELFPIALTLECTGGRAIDPADSKDILARPAEDMYEKGGLVCGTAEEVEFVERWFSA